MKEAAASIYFAGINAFLSDGVEHLIVYDGGDNDYVVAELDASIPLKIVAPNDGSGSILFSRYFPRFWSVAENNALVLAEQSLLGKKSQRGGRIFLDEQLYKVQEKVPGKQYTAPVLKADQNGNIRLFFNPYLFKDIDYETVAYIVVRTEGIGKELGRFRVQKNYSPKGDGQHVLMAGGKEYETGAILNPAHAQRSGDGAVVPTRRANLELFVPFGSIVEVLEQACGVHLQTGDRLELELVYQGDAGKTVHASGQEQANSQEPVDASLEDMVMEKAA